MSIRPTPAPAPSTAVSKAPASPAPNVYTSVAMTEVKKPAPTDIVALKAAMTSLPPNQRLEAILECHDVIKVVRGLPLQDLLTTFKEVGAGDCLELIELLAPEQVRGLIDLDGWRGDRIDSVAVGHWLELLYAANPDRAVRQIMGLDIELISLLLKIHTTIHEIIPDEGLPIDVDLHSITPDGLFLVAYEEASGPHRLLLALKQTVERLFGVDLPFVLRLLQAVRWELPSSLEEEELRWKQGRLADLGFPPLEEALAIFAWRDPDADPPQGLAVGLLDEADTTTDLSTSVLLPWDLFEDSQTVLGAALSGVGEETRERFAHELMLCSNRLHVATGGDQGDPEALRTTVQHATDTVALALSYKSAGDPGALTSVLVRHSVLSLFQIGHSLGTRLHKTWRQRLSDPRGGLLGHGMLRLDTPLREAVAGVLAKRPMFYRGLSSEKRTDFRHFANLAEVAATAQALSEAAFRAALIGAAGLGASDAALEACGVEEVALMPSHATLFATALCRQVMGGAEPEKSKKPKDVDKQSESSFAPLDAPALTALWERMEHTGGQRFWNEEERNTALSFTRKLAKDAFPLPSTNDVVEAEERAVLYAGRVLDAVEAELGQLTDAAPDPRFITTLWTTAALSALPSQKSSDAATSDAATSDAATSDAVNSDSDNAGD